MGGRGVEYDEMNFLGACGENEGEERGEVE